MEQNKIEMPINVIYQEKITENGIYKDWEGQRKEAYFAYRRNWSEYPLHHFSGDFPLNLDIEPTNICNLRCPFCYRTIALEKNSEVFQKQGSMPLETFERIMKQIVKDGICMVPAIKLTHRGEPLLNKHLPEMIRMAKEAGAVDVVINTNGTILTEELALQLLDAGLDKILFSFDSPYPEKYEEIRIGASYNDVLQNIKNFVKLRNEKKAWNTLVRAGMVMTEDILPGEKEDFYKLFENVADVVSYNLVHKEIEVDWQGNYRGADGKQYHVSDRKFADSQLWQRMTINWDGEAEICCENYKQEWNLGNIHRETVHEIWTGDKFEKVRRVHQKGEWWKIAQCRKCTIPHMDKETL